MSKAMPSLTFFLAGSVALCCIFCGRCSAFSEETTFKLENEGAASNSEQLNYWSEEQDGKEVAQGISHETAREVKDVAELVNEYDALTQEHHEGKNKSKAKRIFPFGLAKMENDDSYDNPSNGDSFIQNSD